ncbi:MAG: hypothetical protein ACJ8FU_08275 [Xanthobacteraceae bacterium]
MTDDLLLAQVADDRPARIAELERQIAEARAALGELVALKDMKDAEGASPAYRARKATAWNRARAALQARAPAEGEQ